ncbi:9391_t:CDS:2 [Funneliformis caledonium]|uniref:9391_t:CDS:1 n=1 Tax=Funneliformis caledonium TaxID=1117310 RepID=A0A9N9FJQ2_9GLOM|nr:9391_t:CDS:2 [Funneliformis caledonium]
MSSVISKIPDKLELSEEKLEDELVSDSLKLKTHLLVTCDAIPLGVHRVNNYPAL